MNGVVPLTMTVASTPKHLSGGAASPGVAPLATSAHKIIARARKGRKNDLMRMVRQSGREMGAILAIINMSIAVHLRKLRREDKLDCFIILFSFCATDKYLSKIC
jgi:hypothetical protein